MLAAFSAGYSVARKLNSKASPGAYKSVKKLRESDLEFWGDAIGFPEGVRNAGVKILPY